MIKLLGSKLFLPIKALFGFASCAHQKAENETVENEANKEHDPSVHESFYEGYYESERSYCPNRSGREFRRGR